MMRIVSPELAMVTALARVVASPDPPESTTRVLAWQDAMRRMNAIRYLI